MPNPPGLHHPNAGYYDDYAHVAPPGSSLKLYVGGKPPFDRPLAFDTLVLCAVELQPAMLSFTGSVLRCPIPDDALTHDEIKRALVTSSHVAAALRERRKVLVTCHAGLNRSALVAGMALARLTKLSAVEITTLLRQRRDPQCLFNRHFQGYLARFIEARVKIPLPSGAGQPG